MSELKFKDAKDILYLLVDVLHGLWTKCQDRIDLEKSLPLKHRKSHVFKSLG